MALEEYVGAIVMEVDGQEIEVTDLKEDVTTGRKLVKTMNKTGRAKGFSRGIEEIQLTVTVVIPESGDLNLFHRPASMVFLLSTPLSKP